MSNRAAIVFMLIFMVFCVLQAGLVTSAQKPLPGRVPMHSLLLIPDAEWNAYYDVVPEGERSLYYTVAKGLLPALREQIGNIKDLDNRVKALEALARTLSEPNEVPNAGK